MFLIRNSLEPTSDMLRNFSFLFPNTILLSGPHGIGKFELIEEILNHLNGRNKTKFANLIKITPSEIFSEQFETFGGSNGEDENLNMDIIHKNQKKSRKTGENEENKAEPIASDSVSNYLGSIAKQENKFPFMFYKMQKNNENNSLKNWFFKKFDENLMKNSHLIGFFSFHFFFNYFLFSKFKK